MTVYVEYIFLNNLAINYLVCYLTVLALKERVSILRLLTASVIGAIFAVFYPLLSKLSLVVRLILSVAMVLIIKERYKGIKDFLAAIFIFYLISFTFAGASVMLKDLISIPVYVLSGVLTAYLLVRFVIANLYVRRKEKMYEYDIEIINEGKKVACVGYYDSGNRLYDGKEPIIVISEPLSQKLGLKKSGEIAVRTVAGIKMMELVNINFKIYYDDGVNKIYSTRAAVSENLSSKSYDMILHKDMIS